MRQAKAWIGRKYVWLAAVLLRVAVCVSAAAETYPFTSVATVKVNMRRSASSTAALVDRIPQGASVTVVGSKGNYYKVQYNGQSGYVMKEFISTAAGDVAPPPPRGGAAVFFGLQGLPQQVAHQQTDSARQAQKGAGCYGEQVDGEQGARRTHREQHCQSPGGGKQPAPQGVPPPYQQRKQGCRPQNKPDLHDVLLVFYRVTGAGCCPC